jgi:diguanylate cyclase (GGDEF)-like protein/PAS domain S-box-containing protein
MSNSILFEMIDQTFQQMSGIAVIFEVIDGRFQFLKANQAAYKAGFKKDQYGKFVEEILPDPYASDLNKSLKEVLISGQPLKYIGTFPSYSGQTARDIVITPIFNSQGKCTHILGIERNMTDWKKNKEEFFSKNSFIESFLAITTDGILVMDTDWKIICINPAFTSLFGWKEEDIIGASFHHLNLFPDDKEEVQKNWFHPLWKGNHLSFSRTKWKRKDGKLLYVNFSSSPLKDKKGEITGYIGIFRDITEQIEKERQLEETKQRYQSLIEQHPDAVFQLDLKGHFLEANDATEQATGYTIEELMNRSFSSIIAPDTLAITMENFQAAVQGERRTYKCALHHKNGERVECKITHVPIIVNHTITGVLGIAQNITEQKKIQDELIQTKEILESLFNCTLDTIDILDLNQRVINTNPAFESTYGYTEEEVIGKNLSIIIPENESKLEKSFQTVLDGKAVHGLEMVLRKKDGSLIDVRLSLSPIRNAEGKITSVAAITRNISEEKKAKRRVQESEARYRLIAENMTDLISLLDEDMNILYTSPSHQTVLEVNLKVGEKFPCELIHKQDLKKVVECFQKVVETKKQGRVEFRFQHGESYFVWLDTKMTPVCDENQELQHVLCVSRDITERKQHEAQLEHMAFHDHLTGSYNRRLFMDRLHHTIAQAKHNQESFFVMLLDLDQFKWVNDTLGHDVGDELLVQFVKRVKACIREQDTLARLGGDEFAIILTRISIEDVGKIAKQIVSALQKPWNIKNHEFLTTSSIGIGEYPICGENTSMLMKHADQALYKAKQFGRNNYQFCGHLSNSKESFEQDIKNAILNNEFYLVYQPKFNLSTKRIESIEALIRWEHPQKGVVVPSEFISRAEELDLIVPLTHWVLEQVGMQIKKWESLGIQKIPVSVNISPKHFEKGTLVEDIVEMIKKTGIEPQYLILEMTENTMIRDVNTTIQTIQKLKQMGVKIAIDDFGTGFSSLSYLMKLQVDVLKLDKSFVEELTNQKNASLVHSIISLAHNLNLRVVAEGIETEDQHQILAQYGCDIGQGYLFSKPVKGEELEKMLLNSNRSNCFQLKRK